MKHRVLFTIFLPHILHTHTHTACCLTKACIFPRKQEEQGILLPRAPRPLFYLSEHFSRILTTDSRTHEGRIESCSPFMLSGWNRT